MRGSERAAHRQQAALLDLAYDAIMVYDMEHRLVCWNRGAEARYGWTKEEVLGHSPHPLLQTVFPQPLAAIEDALLRHRRWEGELVHTTRAGTRLVVASRWAVQRDVTGQPVAILEISTDITERKRAAEAVQHHLEWLDTTLSSKRSGCHLQAPRGSRPGHLPPMRQRWTGLLPCHAISNRSAALSQSEVRLAFARAYAEARPAIVHFGC